MGTASRNALSVLLLELNEAERYWIDKLAAEGKLPVSVAEVQLAGSNALPQTARASVNCRILPGESVEEVQKTPLQSRHRLRRSHPNGGLSERIRDDPQQCARTGFWS
jgi:acetylornithine deacetylase/succinyl-diaminopimelate desuccinylase-like protein